MLKCALSQIDPDLWKEVARLLNINPANIGPDIVPSDRDEWNAAVEAFKTAVALPSCVSTSGYAQGWCTIKIDKVTCQGMAADEHRDHDLRMQWIEDEAETENGGGHCKKRNPHYFDETTQTE